MERHRGRAIGVATVPVPQPIVRGRHELRALAEQDHPRARAHRASDMRYAETEAARESRYRAMERLAVIEIRPLQRCRVQSVLGPMGREFRTVDGEEYRSHRFVFFNRGGIGAHNRVSCLAAFRKQARDARAVTATAMGKPCKRPQSACVLGTPVLIARLDRVKSANGQQPAYGIGAVAVDDGLGAFFQQLVGGIEHFRLREWHGVCGFLTIVNRFRIDSRMAPELFLGGDNLVIGNATGQLPVAEYATGARRGRAVSSEGACYGALAGGQFGARRQRKTPTWT